MSTESPAETTHWLNLSNGLEHLGHVPLASARLCRLQSSHCEAGAWDAFLASVPDELLLRLAMGQRCVIHDSGSRRGANPRALWQGLEFLRFVLEHYWFERRYDAPAGMSNHFATVELSRRQVQRIKWFRRWLKTEDLALETCTSNAHHDGDYEALRSILLSHARIFANIEKEEELTP